MLGKGGSMSALLWKRRACCAAAKWRYVPEGDMLTTKVALLEFSIVVRDFLARAIDALPEDLAQSSQAGDLLNKHSHCW